MPTGKRWKPVSCDFDWYFAHPRRCVWPLLADTRRWNEAAGFARHHVREVSCDDGSVRVLAELHRLGHDIRWEELPLDWVRERWFKHRRRFANGPLCDLDAQVELRDTATGCHAHYRLRIVPRNALGALLARLLRRATRRNYAVMLASLREHLDGRREQVFDCRPQLPPNAARLAAHRIAAIEDSAYGRGAAAGLAPRLASYLMEAPESELQPLRPLQLARRWGAPPQAMVELFLQATVSGLLGARWVLLCPRCRVAKVGADNLHSLPEGSHCSSCNIDYQRDFVRNVELAFHPAPAIRTIAHGDFCWMGPMSTPHVLAQLRLAAGERCRLPGDWPRGDYRLRSLAPGAQFDFRLGASAADDVQIDGQSDGNHTALLRWCGDGGELLAGDDDDSGGLLLHNAGERAQSLVIESRDWLGDALTARRVSALQAFRELFSTQTLRPGDQIEIGRMCFLFTDLAGSTALYERLGDAAAYRLVREHFALLGGIVRSHGGGIVKTVGDGVHAVFERTDRALAAALSMRAAMPEFRARLGEPDLGLRIGAHSGECLSVSLNGRLDYYGGTVNLAARLEGQCAKGEIVLSADMARDPLLSELLAANPGKDFTATLKGISEPVACRRLLAAG